ncbi:MAG TPA: class I SAM-dependent methyltransferase [Acidimicrobiales bacterium]|nr:class I SAM-dependent methyltransferase [Acidimicrobiales bacterium]
MDHTDEELDAFAEWERRAWETRAALYAESLTDLTGGAAEALLDAAAVGPGTRVLDVATGPGVVALAARRRGARVTAVDQAEAMVRLARKSGLDARQARAEDLPFEDGAFDAVVGGFLLNHLARPDAGVAQLARVCRGRLALSVWDRPEANVALGLFGPVVESSGLPDVVPPGPDSTLFSDDSRMAALLTTAGLEDVVVSHVGWTVTIDPARWFDAVADGTPRTGAVLAVVDSQERARLRQRYVELATTRYGGAGDEVVLPAAAVVGSGRSGPR